MSAYYNEIDPYAAEWLRNLIKSGHIADGVVDERSISDVRPEELFEFTQCLDRIVPVPAFQRCRQTSRDF